MTTQEHADKIKSILEQLGFKVPEMVVEEESVVIDDQLIFVPEKEYVDVLVMVSIPATYWEPEEVDEINRCRLMETDPLARCYAMVREYLSFCVEILENAEMEKLAMESYARDMQEVEDLLSE